MKRNTSYNISLILDIMIVFYMVTSCRSPNDDKYNLRSSIQPTIVQNVNHVIPMFVNIWKRPIDDDFRDMVFKIVKETSDSIYIDASSLYFNRYTSGKRFMVPNTVYGCNVLYCSYLNLQFDVINNTNNVWDIEELDINVTQSIPDSLPYLYICTADDLSNTIIFQNHSWFNWGGFHFRYSLIKKGEKFNGNYQYYRHVKYFDYDTIINLTPELMEQGYNFKRVCETISYGDFSEKEYEQICQSDYDYKKYGWSSDPEDDSVYEDDKDNEDTKVNEEYNQGSRYETICIGLYNNIDSINYLFYPFEVGKEEYIDESDTTYDYYGYANLIGEVEFERSKYKVFFYANVILGVDCGFGAGSYENDKFDVALRNNDTNYMLRFPYTTVIYPGGSEMVSLTIKAPQSSNHIFNASLKNGNGLTIKSKEINVHYMSPRYYTINN